MLQQQVHIINTFLMILDALCVIASGYFAYLGAYLLSNGRWSMSSNSFVASVLLIMFVNNYIMGRFGLYEDRRSFSPIALISSISKAVFADFAILAAVVFMLKETTYSRKFIVLFASAVLILLILQRLLTHFYLNGLYKKGFNIRKILLVGEQKRCEIVSKALANQLSWGHKVVGRVSIYDEGELNGACGHIKDLPNILRHMEIDEVVFALNGNRGIDISPYINSCKVMGVFTRILPSLWEPIEGIAISVEKCQNIPFITIPVDRISATGFLYKRILDVIGGVLGTLLFFLMYPFVALAIKLDSPGPVLFRQKRVGQHGRLFDLYKFRSMIHNADAGKAALMNKNEMQGLMFKIKNDPRITPVGRFLRKTSLDEFPQFLNVLKGEMSLVGTRPPTPEEVENYQVEHLKRIALKPGITGLWQISGRNQIRNFDEVVQLDCKYMENWRFLNDVIILFKTVFVVLKRKGAI